MKAKEMAAKMFKEKMEEVYQLIPQFIIPDFLTDNGELRSVITYSNLGVYWEAVGKELEANDYIITYGDDALLIDFKP